MKWPTFFLLFIASSLSAWGRASEAPEPITVSVPFAYKGAGIGPSSPDVVVIANNSEEYVASRVIRESLSALGYRVMPHEGDGVVRLSPSKEYRSELLTLSRGEVERYNRTVDGNFRLPNEYIYASAVGFRYQVDTRRQHFEISLAPELHMRGASSTFEPYDRAFDRRFFTDHIGRALRETFNRLCPPPEGCEASE